MPAGSGVWWLMNDGEVQAYYRAALRGLRFVEQRQATGRRFGAEADARWQGFRGHLQTSDRLDLLIRDADAEYAGAFGARTVFAMHAVAEDDAFGPAWQTLAPEEAEELWRGELAEAQPARVGEALAKVAAAWELAIGMVPVGVIGAAERFVVAGPSALISLATAFAEGVDLDWAEQVTVVASPPGHRQLAALAAALVNASSIGKLIAGAASSDPLASSDSVAQSGSPEQSGISEQSGSPEQSGISEQSGSPEQSGAIERGGSLERARLITSPDALAADLTLAQSLAGKQG